MPRIGFGTSRLRGEECERIVLGAIRAGYRSIDTAKFYGNERYVGGAIKQAIAEGICERSDLFITTKLWNDDHRRVLSAARRSLDELGLSYIDLYLVHWPISWRKGTLFCADWTQDQCDTWKNMQMLVDLGLVKNVGVSNFGVKLLRRLMDECGKPFPAVNQLQIHPLSQESELVQFCSDHDIVCTAWSPLAKHSKTLFASPCLSAIANQHGVSQTQVVLKWHLQRGVIVIPKSTNPDHYRDNLDIYKFDLSDQEMRLIEELDRGVSGRVPFDVIGCFEDTAFIPYGAFGQLLKIMSWSIWQFLPSFLEARNPNSASDLFRPLHELTFVDGLRAAFGFAIFMWGASFIIM